VSSIRITTGGESHGPAEVCIIEGLPAGMSLTQEDIDTDLARRQRGYGRGGRMAIETDRCQLVAGVRQGQTIGSPVVVVVENADHKNWGERMRVDSAEQGAAPQYLESIPRPGHADLAGMAKYHHEEIRPVLERASARETTARVAGGAVCRRLLREVGVTVRGRVVQIGGVLSQTSDADYAYPNAIDWPAAESSPVGCDDPTSGDLMCKAIDRAKEDGDSLGGVFEIWAWGICPGLGSYATMDERLDGRLMRAMGCIPAIKGAEIGRAFHDSGMLGSQVHDAISTEEVGRKHRIVRPTNRAAGLEGGTTNGMPLVMRASMKPIPTLMNALPSVDTQTMTSVKAHVERSDVTAVPAATVVAEAMVSWVLAAAYVEKFAADSITELTRSLAMYQKDLEDRGLWRPS